MVDIGCVCDCLRSVGRNVNLNEVFADAHAGHSESLNEDLIRTLRENFYKERFPCDGRINQSIRVY